MHSQEKGFITLSFFFFFGNGTADLTFFESERSGSQAQ